MSIQALAAQARNEQWLLSSDAYEGVMSSLAQGITATTSPPSTSTQGSTAVVPVYGPLLSRKSALSTALGWPTYNEIGQTLSQIEAYGNVNRVILSFDSPGGVVPGTHELAQQIKSMDMTIDAYATGHCCSAAYWLASQCNSITASATSIIGSVGVKTMYFGKDPRSIVAKTSPRKVASAQDMQDIVTAINEVFIAQVAYGRGVSAQHVKDHFGQGGVFVGTQALNAGLVDAIGLMGEVVSGGHMTGAHATSGQDDIDAQWSDVFADMTERQSEMVRR